MLFFPLKTEVYEVADRVCPVTGISQLPHPIVVSSDPSERHHRAQRPGQNQPPRGPRFSGNRTVLSDLPGWRVGVLGNREHDAFGRPHPGGDAARGPSLSEQARGRDVADHGGSLSRVGPSDRVRLAGSRDRERWAGGPPELHRWICSATLRESHTDSRSLSTDSRAPEPSLAAAAGRYGSVGSSRTME